MKNLKNYILSAAVLVGFMSCSSDDNDAVANNVTLEFTNTFNNTTIVGVMLCVTGLILISLKFAPKGKSNLTIVKSLLIGIAQSFAMLPGVSRSGSTITMARHMKIEPSKAAEFSFLMSMPLLFAATLLGAKDLLSGEPTGDVSTLSMIVGFFVAAIIGLISMKILLKLLCANKFWYFGIYCLIAGLSVIIFMR